MKRFLLLLSAVAVMIAVAALAAPRDSELLVLQWARKAQAETPPVAVLIEMGLKDGKPTDWSGRAAVSGAKVVRREGYRFRTEDKLIEPDAWEASSHRGLRAPKGQPQVSKMEGLATVGVVLHLADVRAEASLTLEPKDRAADKVVLPLREVLTGQRRPLWDGLAVVRLVSTATPVTHGKTEDDFPAAAYGPDGTLWVAYISYTVRDDSRRIEQHPFKEQPENFKALYTPEFADQLFVKYYREGKWSKPIAVTGPAEDLVRCSVAAGMDGTVWVAYSAQRGGRYSLFTRRITLAEDKSVKVDVERPVFKREGNALNPVLCTSQDGTIYLADQEWSPDGKVGVGFARYDAGWSTLLITQSADGASWHPALAAGPSGGVAHAYDTYSQGDYGIGLYTHFQQKKATAGGIDTNRFEARPSVAYDPRGRLWIAYEEGPEHWGKDYGALVPNKGNPLYSARSVRVVCLENGGLFRPVAELPTSKVEPPGRDVDASKIHNYERITRYAYPRLGIDGKGRVWLTYRQNFGSRYTTHPGAYWLTFARRLDGDHWSEPIELHHSDGLLDHRPALLPHRNGGLVVIHNTDGRYTTPETIANHIYMSYVDLPGEPAEPKLVPHEPGKKNPDPAVAAEAEAVKRIRAYRVASGGKEYRLLRGEFHRHTEISWDGSPDGSLEDMFRYAIDAAHLDWIGNGDHDNGAGREYPWWLIQKFSDAYHLPGRFTPMFTYERSVPYPHGHRNCMFAKRGVRTLPRLAPAGEQAVGGVHADDTKVLYRYLHEMGGICASHTSNTGMGTDWRDNDPAVEPIVEIYQGDRMSYEHEGAPRAGHDPKSGEEPANIGGWFPKGFINLALQKGYRLGFQSSSDHWSTHISFFVILAERNDRDSLLDAVKKRHCYGATDNIIVDLRSGQNLMGDAFKTSEAPKLEMNVVGTNKLAKIDVLRDSEVLATLQPRAQEYRGTWTDPAPLAGTHYYYIRVLQTDGEIAWASPLWITRE